MTYGHQQRINGGVAAPSAFGGAEIIGGGGKHRHQTWRGMAAA